MLAHTPQPRAGIDVSTKPSSVIHVPAHDRDQVTLLRIPLWSIDADVDVQYAV